MRSFICKIAQKRAHDSVRREGTFFYLTSGVVFAAPLQCPRRGGEEREKKGEEVGGIGKEGERRSVRSSC